MRFMNTQGRFLSPHANSGGGGGDANNDDQNKQNNQANPTQGFNNLLQRENNDAQAAAWLLYQENHDYRRANDDLRGQVQQLQTQMQALQGQLPGEGAVMLTGDNAQLWSQYQQLGAPEVLATQRNELTAMQRRLTFRDAAEAHGYKVAVLQTLADRDALTLEVRDLDGGNGRSAFVITGEGRAEVSLPDYVAAHWQDFNASLVAETQQGTPFFRQNTSGRTNSTDAVQAELDRRYALPLQD